MLTLGFIGLIAVQLIGIALLPRTHGFTNIPMTLGVVAIFTFSYFIIARLIQAGVNLGILIPLQAACLPLITVVLGIVLYGESAAIAKIALLTVACILVGLAARY